MTQALTLVVCGPTASGKSSLAMRLAEAVDGEIVGADSVQIYERLDIGSAKPTPADRARVPHHLVDCVPLDASYDAGDYADQALALITDIQARGKVAIVCGGAGMYLRALLYGLVPSPPSDEALRDGLRERAARVGTPSLHLELSAVDPASAKRIHPNDQVRIIRALEVHALTGRPISDFHSDHQMHTPRLPVWQLALSPPRERLYERINTRVDAMFEAGWRDEVIQILADGFDPGLKPLGSLGYRQLVAYLTGGEAKDEAAWRETIRVIKRDHRRYSKRQLTWLRGQPHIHWFDGGEEAYEAALEALGGRSPK